MDSYKELINVEVLKIKNALDAAHSIGLSVKSEIQYGVKYNVFLAGSVANGVVVVYYSPKRKTFRLVAEANLDNNVFMIIKDIFEKREEYAHAKDLKETKVNRNEETVLDKEDKEKKERYEILKDYYNVLSRYRNDNFDFSDFAEKLADEFSDKKEYLMQNKDNFDALESIYLSYTVEK